MKYDREHAKLVWKKPSELKTTDDPRAFQRHLDEIGNSISSQIGQIEAVIIDQYNVVAVGNTRVISQKESNMPVMCLQIEMDDIGRRLAAWLSNNDRYPTAVETDAVYLKETIDEIISDEDCSKAEAIGKLSEMMGIPEIRIREQLVHYCSTHKEVIAADNKLEEYEKTKPSTGTRLVETSHKTGIDLGLLERETTKRGLTRAQVDIMNKHNLNKIIISENKVEVLGKVMDETKEEVTTISLPILKKWKVSITEMINGAMETYYIGKNNGQEKDIQFKPIVS